VQLHSDSDIVLWAQRSSKTDATRNYVYLTLSVPDVAEKDMKLDIQPTKVTFKGHSHTKNVTYQVDLELFEEIDPKESKVTHTDRDIEMVLRKAKLKEEYWPRLLKDKGKVRPIESVPGSNTIWFNGPLGSLPPDRFRQVGR